MTRKEEILKAARDYISGVTMASPSNFIHFAAGARWADERPNLESLWHDANIVPSENKGIIYLTKNNKLGVFNSIKSNYWDWYVSGKYSIIKWAYKDDLLPKGGLK